ncbi:colanic acid biosynthesis protein WcaM [Escherichia coli]|uniref:colanic acid biosynthesis protein WcaM n=1 Tax=Escherichia coli TaxID=562 RepID=UPI001F494E83|nr:colanic acid biosynthesis protein WcaM [Escherichia coli]MCH6707488.1 colanic acid biosynthesis protein WcaM [Escherichia coli]MCH6765537.1 colanic acid biosynthesis protein WcaM [Escherichia coli]MED8648252.1 colanic acid biosynthesis protein WcaM [Escherichia coli]
MDKKFSRRRFLSAGATLAAIPLLHSPAVRALGRNDAVDIRNYLVGNDWIRAFRQAFDDADIIDVPKGVICDNINTGIIMPPGKTLQVNGSLKGNGRGRFALQDGCKVVGEGSLNNITLDVRGSDCTIEGLAMSGFGPVAQIYIGGKQKRTMRNLTITRINISQANYGILRQGFHNQLDGVKITHSKFSYLQGDAIEWNVAINDKNILISDHVIDHIDCTNGKTNWGIGIGLAGSTYDNNYPEHQAVKNFVVANITGSHCRQLVHVENGKHFIIRNIKARNITPEYSKKAGIDNATVAIYGCDNFVIDGVDMVNSAGMLIGYGVIKGKYLSIPQNFRINNVRMDNRQLTLKLRGIQISSGNAPSFVALTNLDLKHASLEIHNKPQYIFMRNIKVIQPAARGPALQLHFDLRKDVRGKFMAKQETLLSMSNIHAVNENGQRSVDIDRIDQHVVNVDALNFTLPKR